MVEALHAFPAVVGGLGQRLDAFFHTVDICCVLFFFTLAAECVGRGRQHIQYSCILPMAFRVDTNFWVLRQ